MLDNFAKMPFFDPIIKEEVHVLQLYARFLCSRAHSAARPSARATIGYLVYKSSRHSLCTTIIDTTYNLSQRAETCIFVNLEELFTDASLIRETAKFLVRANSRRFPKKEVAKTHAPKTHDTELLYMVT